MGRRDVDQDQWLEISVRLPAEYAEPVTHLFSRYGDGRVFVVQSGDWDADDSLADSDPSDDVDVFCYLQIDDTVENRKGMITVGLRLMAELTDMQRHNERMVSAEEWANQSFPTIRVGDRIVISPWSLHDGIPEQPTTEAIHVFLSPGLAFGTGNHPTTRLCLEQIIDDADAGNLADANILDVGCGSGILAIAGIKLGANHAWCLDIDETAVRAVRDNLSMSTVSEHARVLQGSVPNPNLPDMRFDYVFANITSRVLIDLAQPLINCTKDHGVILASGILEDQLTAVRKAFLATGEATIAGSRHEGDWVMLKINRIANR